MGRFSDDFLETLRVIDDNPAYRDLFLSLLDYCGEERIEEDAVAYGESLRTDKKQIQGASSLVAMLVNCGALERTVLVDGRLYEGSLADAQADESISEDADMTTAVRTTEAGASAVRQKSEELTFESLLIDCPWRKEAFLEVLSLCAAEDGKSTRELQDALKALDMLETEERGIDTLHASYFTGSLEHISALVWNGKKWVTSEKGFTILARATREGNEREKKEECI